MKGCAVPRGSAPPLTPCSAQTHTAQTERWNEVAGSCLCIGPSRGPVIMCVLDYSLHYIPHWDLQVLEVAASDTEGILFLMAFPGKEVQSHCISVPRYS